MNITVKLLYERTGTRHESNYGVLHLILSQFIQFKKHVGMSQESVSLECPCLT